jgi:hypothetical protein
MKVSAIGFLLVAAMAICQPAAAADETSVKAFVAWTARGVTYQTGPHQATFVGALAGPVFVDMGKGLVHAGQLMCPTVVEIGLEDGKETGQGRCVITAKDGAVIYAQLNCSGVYMIGCHGALKFTGGTDRFTGITGGGKAVIRSDLQQFVAVTDKAAAGEGVGSLSLPDIKYKLP